MWLPPGLFGGGGVGGSTRLGDPGRHGRGRAAAVRARRGGPACGTAGAGHCAGAGGSEPGGCGPGRGTGTPVAAGRGAALQCRRPGGAARPPPVGSAGEADRGAAGRVAGVGACRAGPGGGWREQLPPARHRRPHPGALGGILRAVRPVPDAAPHRPVMADDPARPPQGRCRGTGAI